MLSLLYIVLLSVITSFFYKLTRPRRGNSIPSPPKLPIIGNLHQLGSLPHCSLHALSQKYGQIILLRFGCVPTLLLSSADTAHEVMKVHDLAFSGRAPSSIADRLLYNSQDVAFATYGDYWRKMRQICVLHLLSLKRVQSFGNIRTEEVSLMVEKIQAGPQPVNLSEMILALTNDITSRVAFGRKYSCSTIGSRARAVLADFLSLLGEFSVGDFIPWLSWLDTVSGLDARLRSVFRQLDAFTEEVMEDHVQNRERQKDGQVDTADIVDVLMSLAKDDTDGISLTKDNIKAIILDMYAGGTHTTFSALEWTMAELIRQPKIMKRVQDEVRGVLGLKQSIQEDHLVEMNYMKAVIKESLRLHPPVPLLIPRESMKDIELMGYHIPSGTRMMINAWSIGRDPKSWERPEEFLPDRFMGSSVDFRGQHFQFVPFGAGRRGCPGSGFAMSVVELVLVKLLLHFDWELPDGKEGESLDMSETSGITCHMKYGLVLIAKPMF